MELEEEINSYNARLKNFSLKKARSHADDEEGNLILKWTGIPSGNPGSRAYSIFLEGNTDKALTSISLGQKDCDKQERYICSWRLELFKARILQTIGRGADLENVMKQAAEMEKKINGGSLITRAWKGSLSLSLGDYELALQELTSVAIEIGNWKFPTMSKLTPADQERLRSQLSDPDWWNHLYTMVEVKSRTHVALSKLFYLKKEYDQALLWGTSAENLMFKMFDFAAKRPNRESSPTPIHAEVFLGRGETYAYIAASLLALEADKERAEEMFSVAQSYFRAADAYFGSAVISAIRAKAFYDANMIDDFILAADEAVALASKIGFGELVWQIEALRGEVLLAQGDIMRAEKSLRRAQEAIDLVSGSLSSDRAKLKFGVGKDTVTRLLAGINVQNGNISSLYADLERGRARAFVDMIGETLVGGTEDRDLTNRIRKLDAQIRQRRLLLSTAGASVDTLESTGDPGEEGLLLARNQYVTELREKNPDLAAALSISTTDIYEVEDKLKDGDVIAYPLPAEATDPIKILLISKTGKEVKDLQITGEKLGELLSDFQFGVELDDENEQIMAGDSLFDLLQIENWGITNTLYIVPSSEFYFVPWGALPINNPVIVLPTAGWLARNFSNDNKTSAVIIGDPEFGGVVPQLPGARLEAINLATQYKVPPLIGSDATAVKLYEKVGNGVFLIHLATHGIFDSEDPMKSAIILSDGTKASYLTAAHIFENPISADLIVLSACDTGVGQAISGDDFLGLARSLYIGGASTVLNSLWPISDANTAHFMEHFHQSAQNGNVAGAWLTARNKLRDSGAKPADYGAFILGGAANINAYKAQYH
jgi:tetratricopeptide (TPR) repeat protein